MGNKQMRIAYICYITNQSTARTSQPVDILSKGVIYGLEKASSNKIDVFSVFPVPMFPRSRVIFSPVGRFKVGETSVARYIPFINVPLIKQLTIFIAFFFQLLGWAWHYRKEKNKIILSYGLFSPIALPAYTIARLFSASFVPQMPDPPFSSRDYKGWKKKLMDIDACLSKWMLKRVSYCVGLTQQLCEDFAPGAAHHVHKCGINPEQIHEPALREPASRHVVIYSGLLGEYYLIPLILESFEFLDPDKYELHIYGKGVYEKQVIEAQQRCGHIKYMGFVPHDELVRNQQAASLLLSPKDPRHPIVHYNFSSKLLEYLAGGTPVLMTDTHEARAFGDAVFVIKDLTPKAVAEDIRRACALSPEQRMARAEKVNKLLMEEYTWKAIGQGIYQFFKDITSDKKRCAS